MIDVQPMPPTKIAERVFRITVNGLAAFEIGFQRMSLIGNEVYIVLAPLAQLNELPPKSWRELKNKIEEYGDLTLVCQVAKDDFVGRRFAEFFGFEPIGSSHDRIHYEKVKR